MRDVISEIRPEFGLEYWEKMQLRERKEAFCKLLVALGTGNNEAGCTLYGLARSAIRLVDDVGEIDVSDHYLSSNLGFFHAVKSAPLLTESERLEGYYRAINSVNSQNIKSVVEVGAGPAAVLSLFAAIAHPNAEIVAYELSDVASKAARKMIQIFGFGRQITVITANALDQPIEPADMAITETFRPGQFIEPGLKLMHLFAELDIPHIIPDRVDMLYQVNSSNMLDAGALNGDWRLFQSIIAGEEVETINGVVSPEDTKPAHVLWVRSDYHYRDLPMLVGACASPINRPVDLCRIRLPSEGVNEQTGLKFSYLPHRDIRDAEITTEFVEAY